MTSSWSKFKLLMWKNWTLQKRHKIRSVFEVLVPILFMCILVLIRSLVEPTMENETRFVKFKASELVVNLTIGPPPMDECDETGRLRISYSPKNDVVQKLIENSLLYLISDNVGELPFGNRVDCPQSLNVPFISVVGYPNAAALDQQLTNPILNDTSLCGIEFQDSLKDLSGTDKWPEDTLLTLRFPSQLRNVDNPVPFLNWRTDIAFPVVQFPGPRSRSENYGGWPSYVKESFLPIAHALSREITKTITKKVPIPVWVSRYPYPEYLNDILVPILKSFISIFVILSYCYPCINIIRSIATEKEKQLKEVMKIMGLPNWLHWTAWFIKTFIFLMISTVAIVVILKVEWYKTGDGLSGYSLFTYTPWHFILFFMVLYMITSISYFFMISTFFSKANTAASVGGLLWFLSNVGYTFLSSDQYIPSVAVRLVVCLISNTAMSYGFDIILSHESTSEGLQWSRILTPLTDNDPFVMGHVILMLVVDAVLYFMIALYVEQVFPGAYGVPQRWYFPFTKKFWFSMCGCYKPEEITFESHQKNDIEGIEAEPENLKIGIDIMNLSKKFKDKVAVDKLSLRIYENQVTVLLGHNGAGKTTTMSMLTGVLPPTTGTASVAGCDIRTDINGVRSSLGLCPQHNVLFNDLTVAEHIYFYARLKGMSGRELDDEVERYVNRLGLKDKKNVKSSALSGGMKRRLSVGTALSGGSKVVILDEPTSGMDPSSRRELWDLITSEKKGRTLILTTHFMDEAEILGERVAILSGGKLRCVGSPFYLKKKFGMGYRLTATRDSYAANNLGVSAIPVTNILRKHIPDVNVYTDIGSEISYILADDKSSCFPTMLEELEKNQENLGILGFGITASNLEDVFMRVGADIHNFDKENDNEVHDQNQSTDYINASGSESFTKYYGTKLVANQWKAMLLKKSLVALRSWISHLLQLALPVLFISIAIVSSRMFSNPVELVPRTLELANGYSDSNTFLESVSDAYTEAYKKYFKDAGIASMRVFDVDSDTNMTDYYLNEARKDLPVTRLKNLVGATFENKSATAWFSNFGHHELPASLMLIHNAMLQTFSPNSKITLVNKPLPFSLQSQFDFITFGNGSAFQTSLNVGLCMAFVSAFFILFYIRENSSRSKLLQLASGASPLTLWFAAYLWDMIWMVFIAGSTCVTMLAFQENGMKSFEEIARIFLLIWIFGWAMLPINYWASTIFKSPSSGFSRMILINAFSGMGAFIAVEVLITPGLELGETGNILHYIFLVFPHYAISSAVKRLIEASITVNFCHTVCDRIENCTAELICKIQSQCCISDYPYFEWEKPGVGANLTYMLIVGAVFIAIVIAQEYKIHNLIWRPKHAPPPPINPADEDSDVASEREHIMRTPPTQYMQYNLLCKQMSKYYNNFLAVDQLTLGVRDGECFGLLGINGAGKTTTFKMLTGDLLTSFGDAWVKGFSINTDMKTVHQNIGYCPQFDALIEELTGRETLRMFSLLRGIPKWRQEQYIVSLGKKLGFTKHIDKKVNEYSGGNKRKLSTALALLGDPRVVYLDEPTTGMDPAAKRLVWNAVSQCGCVILTSHSMEECEALCSRIAIMVNGRPCCLGSPQHLKNKFSQGYTLIVKMKKRPDLGKKYSYGHDEKEKSDFDFDDLNQFLMSRFPTAKVLETYQGIVTYHLPDTSIKWSTIFNIMESAKQNLNMEDYSIGQTTLEQIFLQFTKAQLVSEIEMQD